MFQKQLSYSELGITLADLQQQIGYSSGAEADAGVVHEVEAVMSEAARVARPRFCFLVSNAQLLSSSSAAQLVVQGETFNIGHIIARQLRGSTAFALFLATAGNEYEQWRTSQTDLVRNFIADALGSLIAERSADLMEEMLQATIQKLNWNHTNRFSPGYCGWHVSEQQHLLPLFGSPNPCDITLTESSLMLPIKSVSGVIGLGPDVHRLDYTCNLCNFPNCFRRKPASR